MISLFTNISDVAKAVASDHPNKRDTVNQLTRMLGYDIESFLNEQKLLAKEIRDIYLPLFDQLNSRQQDTLRACMSSLPIPSNLALSQLLDLPIEDAQTLKEETNTIVNLYCQICGYTTPRRWSLPDPSVSITDERYDRYRPIVNKAIKEPKLHGLPLQEKRDQYKIVSQGTLDPYSIYDQVYEIVACSILNLRDYAIFMHGCMPNGSCYHDPEKLAQLTKLDCEGIKIFMRQSRLEVTKAVSHFLPLLADYLEPQLLRKDFYSSCDVDLPLVKDLLFWADNCLSDSEYRHFSIYAQTRLVRAECKKDYNQLSEELKIDPNTLQDYSQSIRRKIQSAFFTEINIREHPLTNVRVLDDTIRIHNVPQVIQKDIDPDIDVDGNLQMIARTLCNIEDYYIFCASKLYKKEKRVSFKELDQLLNRESEGEYSYRHCVKTQKYIKDYILFSNDSNILHLLDSNSLSGGHMDVNQNLLSTVDLNKIDLSPNSIQFLHDTARTELSSLEYVCLSLSHFYSSPYKMDVKAISQLVDKKFNYIQEVIGEAKNKLRHLASERYPGLDEFPLFRKFNISGLDIPENLSLSPSLNSKDPDALLKRSLAKALLASDQYYFYIHLCTTNESSRSSIATLGEPLGMNKSKASGRFRPCRDVVDSALAIEKSFPTHKPPVLSPRPKNP